MFDLIELFVYSFGFLQCIALSPFHWNKNATYFGIIFFIYRLITNLTIVVLIFVFARVESIECPNQFCPDFEIRNDLVTYEKTGEKVGFAFGVWLMFYLSMSSVLQNALWCIMYTMVSKDSALVTLERSVLNMIEIEDYAGANELIMFGDNFDGFTTNTLKFNAFNRMVQDNTYNNSIAAMLNHWPKQIVISFFKCFVHYKEQHTYLQLQMKADDIYGYYDMLEPELHETQRQIISFSKSYQLLTAYITQLEAQSDKSSSKKELYQALKGLDMASNFLDVSSAFAMTDPDDPLGVAAVYKHKSVRAKVNYYQSKLSSLSAGAWQNIYEVLDKVCTDFKLFDMEFMIILEYFILTEFTYIALHDQDNIDSECKQAMENVIKKLIQYWVDRTRQERKFWDQRIANRKKASGNKADKDKTDEAKEAEMKLLLEEQDKMVHHWYIHIPITNEKPNKDMMFKNTMDLSVTDTHVTNYAFFFFNFECIKYMLDELVRDVDDNDDDKKNEDDGELQASANIQVIVNGNEVNDNKEEKKDKEDKEEKDEQPSENATPAKKKGHIGIFPDDYGRTVFHYIAMRPLFMEDSRELNEKYENESAKILDYLCQTIIDDVGEEYLHSAWGYIDKNEFAAIDYAIVMSCWKVVQVMIKYGCLKAHKKWELEKIYGDSTVLHSMMLQYVTSWREVPVFVNWNCYQSVKFDLYEKVKEKALAVAATMIEPDEPDEPDEQDANQANDNSQQKNDKKFSANDAHETDINATENQPRYVMDL